MVSIISERERPKNVPPAITGDKQARRRPIATTMRVSSIAASFRWRELDAIKNLLTDSVLAKAARLFQQSSRSFQIHARFAVRSRRSYSRS